MRRCEHLGRDLSRGRFLLCHGSRLPRLRTFACVPQQRSLLRDAHEGERSVTPALLSRRRFLDWLDLRSHGRVEDGRLLQTLSGRAAPRTLSRRGTKLHARFPDQQLRSPGTYDCSVVQVTLEGGTLL